LYAAGLRVSEACGLRWRNLQVRGDAGQVLIHGKGGRTRVVFLAARRVGPAPRPEGRSWPRRATVRVTFGEAVGTLACYADRPGCQPTGRNHRCREHPLAPARPRFPRSRPGEHRFTWCRPRSGTGLWRPPAGICTSVRASRARITLPSNAFNYFLLHCHKLVYVNAPDIAPWVGLAKDAITGIAAGVASVVAVAGLHTWKRQLHGNTNYELARGLLRSAYKLREAIRWVRSLTKDPTEGAAAILQSLATNGYNPSSSYGTTVAAGQITLSAGIDCLIHAGVIH
jgi:hypothetical protein